MVTWFSLCCISDFTSTGSLLHSSTPRVKAKCTGTMLFMLSHPVHRHTGGHLNICPSHLCGSWYCASPGPHFGMTTYTHTHRLAWFKTTCMLRSCSHSKHQWGPNRIFQKVPEYSQRPQPEVRNQGAPERDRRAEEGKDTQDMAI